MDLLHKKRTEIFPRNFRMRGQNPPQISRILFFFHPEARNKKIHISTPRYLNQHTARGTRTAQHAAKKPG